MKQNCKALTFMELLICVILLSLIALGVSGFQLFSYQSFHSSDRRGKIQNDVTLIVEHITKSLINAEGYSISGGCTSTYASPGPVFCSTVGSLVTCRIMQTNNADLGVCDNNDGIVQYRYDSNTHILNYRNGTSAWETLSNRVVSFDLTNCQQSRFREYSQLNVTVCYNPAGVCGDINNPAITMDTKILMPQVCAQ